MYISTPNTVSSRSVALASIAVFAPLCAWAASDVWGILSLILTFIRTLTVLVFALAVVIFFWGVVKFILNAANSDGHREGVNLMIWGIISLFVMASLWGLVGILQETFDLDNSTNDISVPQLDVSS